MMTFLKTSWHYIAGLSGIGAISALAATGTIPGTDALPVIVGIVSALIGGGLVAAGTNK